MAKRPEYRMPVSQRAKQFAPFSALRGLPEALKAKEKIYEQRKELFEDEKQKINAALANICKGDDAALIYYKNGEYLTAQGTVDRKDTVRRMITIDDMEIPFDNIFGIIK